MQSKKALNKKMPSTQRYLPIQEIKDGVVILKDGSLRGVLMVSSINFMLKSEDEQNAIVSAYVSFLNSLDHPLQIVVQSRRLQMDPYLTKLAKLEQEQANELLRIQIADYRAFVKELVEVGQIMSKRFYVVVPYDPATNSKKSFFVRIKEVLKPSFTIRLKEERFMERKKDLDLRLRQVVNGLTAIGLTVVPLDTQALVELYYASYNPDLALTEQLAPVDDLRIENL